MNEKKLAKRAEKYDGEHTVDTLIDVLKTFPKGCPAKINGNITVGDINFDDDGNVVQDSGSSTTVKISDLTSDANIADEQMEEINCGNQNDEIENPYDKEHKVIANYLYGNPELFKIASHTVSDDLFATSICYPGVNTQLFESAILSPSQKELVDEIREKNMLMATMLAEQYRRGLSAMFEYNLQCMYMYGRTMCSIVDKKDDDYNF